MMGNVKRPYHKRFKPRGWDVWDRTVIEGGFITNGAVVTVIAHNGPFRIVRDQKGNVNAVGRGSLVPVWQGEGD